MSQVNTSQDIYQVEIQTIQNQMNVATGTALSVASVAKLNSVVSKLFPESVAQGFTLNAQKIALNKGPILSSTQQLRVDFQQNFQSEVQQLEASHGKSLEVNKAGFLNTLSKMDLKMTDIKVVESQLMVLASSKSLSEAKTAMIEVMQTLEVQHQQVFTHTISVALQESMVSAGLSQVKVEALPNMIRVVGNNLMGNAMVSEVMIDSKTQKVDVVSETIGFEGDGCKNTMNKFLSEIEKRGLKCKMETGKKTGKVPVGNYAQQLDKVLKTEKVKTHKPPKPEEQKPKLPPPPSMLKH